jgi:DNA-binding response OmpR family regulator
MNQEPISRETRDHYGRSGRTRILLAEDDVDLRSGFGDALEGAGFAVLTAADGKEMLALFSSAAAREIAPPDAIVMDVRMPQHSGLQLLIALRLAEWPVPVVLVTGFADAAFRARALDLGAHAVLQKPVSSEELVRVVRCAIDVAQDLGGSMP